MPANNKKSSKNSKKNGGKSKKKGIGKKKNTPTGNPINNTLQLSGRGRKRNRNRGAKGSISKLIKLSKCGLRFLSAVCMPFAPESKGSCIPMLSSQPSHKETGYIRTDVTANAQGVIWLLPVPCLANDIPGLFIHRCGTAKPTGVNIIDHTTGTLANSAANGFTTYANFSNLAYSAADFGLNELNGSNKLNGRIVSYGLRVAYTGTNLNLSGLTYCYANPRHENMTLTPGLLTSNTVAGLAGFLDTDISAVSREYCELNIYPVLPEEREYSGTVPGGSVFNIYYPYSQSAYMSNTNDTTQTIAINGYNVGAPPGAIVVSGLQNNATVHVEAIIHVEYSGITADPVATLNSAHLDDMAIVSSIVENIPAIKAMDKGKSMWQCVKEAATMASKEATKFAIPAAEMALAAVLA